MKQIQLDLTPFITKCALVENNRVTELIISTNASRSIVGNIYAAKVMDVVRGRFAFISIGEPKNGFLQLDDYRQSGISSLSNGKRILVQVLRDEVGDKGAMLSCSLSFSGRLLVLTKSPTNDSLVAVSNKITSKATRERLKGLCEGLCPENFGIIVRTEAENAPDSEIQREIDRLHKEALEILEKAKTAPMPTRLYGSDKIYARALRDLLDARATQIVVNDKDELPYIKALAADYANVSDISYSSELRDINVDITQALRQKVWLKSGAYLLIEESDTCTFIDVNTGKYSGKKDPAAIAALVNIEAAKEIAAQIRLRNISGVIIVDFVGRQLDSGERSNELEQSFKAALQNDRTPAAITDWSELNVVMLTRKYSRLSLKNTLTDACPICTGSGRILSATFFADKIYKEIINIYSNGFCGKIRVDAHEDIVKILENEPKMVELAEVKSARDAKIGFYEIRSK